MSKEPLITASGWGLTSCRIIKGNALIEIGARRDRGDMSKRVRTERQ